MSFNLVNSLAIYLLGGISQSFLFPCNTQSGNNYLFKRNGARSYLADLVSGQILVLGADGVEDRLPGRGDGDGVLARLPAALPVADQLFIFGKRRRCLHDYVAGTQVVRLPNGVVTTT